MTMLESVMSCCVRRKLSGPQTISVEIKHARGLKQLNITGDAPYCVCKVHGMEAFETATDMARHLTSKCQTKSLQGSLDPDWNETFELTGWYNDKPLEFTIYDKGLAGAKVEGKVSLDPTEFYPRHFNDFIYLTEDKESWIAVAVTYVGPTTEPVSDKLE
mmetsp:Transcript_62921/g.178765  ORF Transcript_62921/g.178765 Transcript_62921/m.178765 type:complete len:160 (-) Transcript_62921:142-621(-)|eukprot:CAMPEP_0168396472 /NCGR_PEP_ID=MMETSP0228-20121227/20567_1 /TAXON_ID=133427 /ORGANISM="Protoceratium reticulatum, Strain CCCM 535 (=CCMP 1889)" /LENGTH=159 /DNA_ID=CAMNT_0008409917 /DNA_START=74 /DNA_END=553 /DNA_ORIENTATION=+